MKKSKVNQTDVPRFVREDEERDFWAKHSVLDFPDRFRRVTLDLSRLKPSTQAVTVRIPSGMLSDLRMLANRRDVPYQSLLKIFLAERVEAELAGPRAGLKRP